MFWILAVVLIVFFLASAIKVLREYERGVIFRLGRVIASETALSGRCVVARATRSHAALP